MHPRFPAPDRRAQICSGGLCVRPSFAGELALAVRHHAVRYGGAVRSLREEPGLPRTGHDAPNGFEFSNAIIVEAWRRSLGLSEARWMLVPRRANPRRQEVRAMPCHAGGCAYVYTARAGGLHPLKAEGEANDERPAREEAQAGMLAVLRRQDASTRGGIEIWRTVICVALQRAFAVLFSCLLPHRAPVPCNGAAESPGVSCMCPAA